jgi:N-acetyl-gamma-glutamyl-phosphate reductase
MKKIKVSLMGGTGYAAAELIKRLLTHPNVELVKIASIDHVGENIGKVHKNFGNRLDYVFENLTAAQLAEQSDLVFLALPHKVSFSKMPEFFPFNVKLIDFSGDYRIQDAKIYEQFYGATHSNPENIKSFVYGLPELNKEQIEKATRIANPGCFATASALSVLPLAKAGLLSGKIRIVGPTGSSGAGVAPSEGTHHPIRHNNMKSYKPLNHQHQPEIEQTLRLAGGKNISIDFIPISAPLSRGILVNTICDLPANIKLSDIEQIYKDYYKNAPFIRLTGSKELPEVVSIAGTNFVEIGWALKEEFNGTKSFAAVCTIDNLVKGAAGQAVQNMNLMYGLEEMTGLDDFGRWP